MVFNVKEEDVIIGQAVKVQAFGGISNFTDGSSDLTDCLYSAPGTIYMKRSNSLHIIGQDPQTQLKTKMRTTVDTSDPSRLLTKIFVMNYANIAPYYDFKATLGGGSETILQASSISISNHAKIVQQSGDPQAMTAFTTTTVRCDRMEVSNMDSENVIQVDLVTQRFSIECKKIDMK